jgi:hypothetical protein
LVSSAAEYCFFQQSAQGAQVAHNSFLAMHTNAGAYAPPPAASYAPLPAATYAPPPAVSPDRKRRADDMDCDGMDVEGGEGDYKRSCGGC